MEFKPSVISELQFYVYCLVDPRDNRIFYIGKGCGNRVFQHANDAISTNDDNLRLEIIRDIISKGYSVKYFIIRHKLTEAVAYQIESTLIDFLTFKDFNLTTVLTNIQSGYHQWNEGIKSIEDIIALYDCNPLNVVGSDRLMIVKLNKTYEGKSSEKIYQRDSMYEKVRKYWKLNPEKARRVDFVLAVFKGIVRAVYKPDEWYAVQDPNLFSGTRYVFEGKEIKNSPYLNKDVSEYVKGMNPVQYINI